MSTFTRTQTLNNLYVTTLQNREKELTNQIFEQGGFFQDMKDMGHVKKMDGGRDIEMNVQYAKNTTVKGIGRGSTIAPEDKEFETIVKYDWRFVAGSHTRYYTDDKKNRGKNRVRNMVNDGLDLLVDSIYDKLEDDVYLDGTGDSGNTINGLSLLVQDDPTSTTINGGMVGNISQATNAWWRNQYKNMTGLDLSTQLRPWMNNMYNNCSKKGNGNNKGTKRFPTYFMTTQAISETYDAEAYELRSIVNSQKGDIGMSELAYKGHPLRWAPSMPDYRMYMLNMNNMFLAVMDNGTLEFTNWKDIPNSLDHMMHAVFNGNVITNKRVGHGVMYNLGN